MRTLTLVLMLVAAGCDLTPQWLSGYPGPFSTCGAAYQADNLVKATIVDWRTPVKRATNLTASPVWYTPLELEVKEARWGALAGRVTTHFPQPIGALQLSNKSTTAWVFLRGTTERGTEAPFYWTGASHVLLFAADGSLDTVRGHFKSEADFLAEADAARVDPRCAFNPNLVLSSPGDSSPDAQFFPNLTDAGP